MTGENILRRIRGDDVSRAASTLPKYTAESPPELEAVIDVLELGRVLFAFKRFEQKRGKLRGYFWTAERIVRSREASP